MEELTAALFRVSSYLLFRPAPQSVDMEELTDALLEPRRLLYDRPALGRAASGPLLGGG
jgi:hypothetical protein